MLIRVSTPADLDDLAHVHREAWLQSHSRFFPDHFLQTRTPQYFTELWQTMIKDQRNLVLVLEVDGSVVGFARYGEPSKSAVPGTGELHNLYLMPQLRQQGYGSELLRIAERGLRELGYSHGRLSVAGGNIEATDFYLANGWTFDGPETVWQFGGVELSFRLMAKPLSL